MSKEKLKHIASLIIIVFLAFMFSVAIPVAAVSAIIGLWFSFNPMKQVVSVLGMICLPIYCYILYTGARRTKKRNDEHQGR